MTELAKWAWIIVLIVFFVGENIIWYILGFVVVYLLIRWLKPEWLDKL